MRRLLAVLALLAGISPAAAQLFPQTLPANTVVGRLGIGAGQAQAIPFATLSQNLLTGLCTTSGAVPVYDPTNLWVCSTAALVPVQFGASGVAGALVFGNATSGLLTLQPVTGALGTVTLSLPAATDTLVGKATTDILTGKTYDTAGAGNVFKINGTTISAVTGTGSTAVLSTAPTIGTSLVVPLIAPPSDSTTAFKITKADLATAVLTADTTNRRIGINKTPGAFDLDVNGAANLGSTLAVATSLAVPIIGPATDTTTALKITKADLSTAVVTFDTTNRRVGINKTPGAFDLDVAGAVNFASTIAGASSATLGANGATGGSITLNGATSGSGIINVAAAAGAGIVLKIPSAQGTSGQFLQLTDNAGTTAWVAGSGAVTSGNRVLIATLTASNSSVNLDSSSAISATYDDYEFVLDNLIPATNASNVKIQVNIGGIQTTSYSWSGYASSAAGSSNFGNASTSGIFFHGNNLSNTLGISGTVKLLNANSGAANKLFAFHVGYQNSSGPALETMFGDGWYTGGTGAITDVRFVCSSNWNTGTIKIYGIVK